MTVARTILDQLGGSRFVAMTGARDFVSSADSLSFRLPRIADNGANKVTVTLTAGDEYRVAFDFIGRFTYSPVESFEGVQASQLGEAFTRHTGLAIRL